MIQDMFAVFGVQVNDMQGDFKLVGNRGSHLDIFIFAGSVAGMAA